MKCMLSRRVLIPMGLGGMLAVTAFVGAPARALQAPQWISQYSFVQFSHKKFGSFDYFGSAATGNSVRAAYQFGAHGYVFGSYGRFSFDQGPGRLYQTGVGIGYAQTEGNLSAYISIAAYRQALSASRGGQRDYYYEGSYGVRAAVTRHFAVIGSIYSDFATGFGSRPWGVKVGVALGGGPLSVEFYTDHNRDVNSMTAAVRLTF